MKTIIIEKDAYKVEIDDRDNNHTLYQYDAGGKEVNSPKGPVITKPKWEIIGYYPNMKQALASVIGLKLAEGDQTWHLEEYLQELKQTIADVGGRMNK